MQGALGIGANLNRWSNEDSALATRMIAAYKRIRNTVQLGQLYRLLSPRTNDVSSVEYVAQDGRQAVLFAYRHSQEFNVAAPAIRLRGLDPAAIYHLEPIAGRLQDSQTELSGAWLMNHGIAPNLRGDYDSMGVILDRKQ
jgi:alpha-galactosidase